MCWCAVKSNSPFCFHNPDPNLYTWATDSELSSMNFVNNWETRTTMRTGGYASNLAFNKVTGKFWRLYLNAAQPGKDFFKTFSL